MPNRHPSLCKQFRDRASGSIHPLTSYLYRLMEVKSSNLCLSADVHNARELLAIADKLGPSIVVLKTHHDLIAGWDYNPQTGTGARLGILARKHGFLIFEDRKFVDIGKTVQMQYTAGTARIIDWAHIVNAHMDAGKPMVTALAEAAARWRERINYEIRTSVTVGTPLLEHFDDTQDDGELDADGNYLYNNGTTDGEDGDPYGARPSDGRKGSIVSVTTLTQSFEPAGSPRLSKIAGDAEEIIFAGIEEAPLERGLLLVAQMSTKGCLIMPEYTMACVEAARENPGFVIGFIAQESLNSEAGDNFIHMSPGCKLPPVGEEENGSVAGDELGQQYSTPAKLVGICGTDIVIVGRGITQADDAQVEAERYRRKAWKAYQVRVSC